MLSAHRSYWQLPSGAVNVDVPPETTEAPLLPDIAADTDGPDQGGPPHSGPPVRSLAAGCLLGTAALTLCCMALWSHSSPLSSKSVPAQPPAAAERSSPIMGLALNPKPSTSTSGRCESIPGMNQAECNDHQYDQCNEIMKNEQKCQWIADETAQEGGGGATPGGRSLPDPPAPPKAPAALRGADDASAGVPGAHKRAANSTPAAARTSTTSTMSATKTSTKTSTTSTTRARGLHCPKCAPKRPTLPAVVIPSYEHDLCKLRYTVASIIKHDAGHLLGDVFVLWVSSTPTSQFVDKLEEIKGMSTMKRTIHLIDFSWQMNQAGKSGWFAQQVLKLKIADILSEEYYVVMDSKNTLIRPFKAEAFFTPCNQAKIFGQYKYDEVPPPHSQWYATSAGYLNVEPPHEGYWPASITPMTLHRQTVIDMLGSIGENPSPYTLCSGPLCGFFDNGGTEFTMYLMYARSKTKLECIHAVSRTDWAHEVAISLWRGLKWNVDECKNVARGYRKPYLFGLQAGSLDGLPEPARRNATRDVVTIFKNAKLHDPSIGTVEEFIACMG